MVKDKQKIFPYEPKRKIVVVGGSTAWSKEMKRLLINVDIVHVDSKKTYKNLILKADVVWINTWISHSYQEKILKITRKYNKDTKFFLFKGCRRCAEQIFVYEEDGTYENYLIQSKFE